MEQVQGLGWKRWLVAVTISSAERAAEVEAIAANGKIRGYQADVGDASGAADLISRVATDLGSIDALVNNAGIRRDVLTYNMSDDDWRVVLQTNLDGAFVMMRAVIPLMMRQRRGAIVNVASLSGLHGVAGQANYSAAKGGLIAMTRSIAREIARSGIRINCVAPGLVDTDMISGMDPEARKEMIRAIPMRRAVRPEEVAAAVVFLLSGDSSAITGQTLPVDCGTSA